MKLRVKVQPKSSSNEIIGMRNQELIIKTTAAPDKGKANDAVIKLLSKHYKIPKSSITIESGLTSPHKTININTNIKKQSPA